MHADKKPKLNTRHKSNELDVDSDFEGRNIHDKYHELYRILFQDVQKIKQYLLDIIAIAQNIIASPLQNNTQNVQNMKLIAQNIKKELEYYVDPHDIQGIDEHRVSEKG